LFGPVKISAFTCVQQRLHCFEECGGPLRAPCAARTCNCPEPRVP
jgi:hypothetical protein